VGFKFGFALSSFTDYSAVALGNHVIIFSQAANGKEHAQRSRPPQFNTTNECDECITRPIAPTLQWWLHPPEPLQVATIAQPRHRPEQHLDHSQK
jgi:hypothetical protein